MSYSIFDETMVVMTWPEIEEAARRGAIVLLPVGIIEEHGPHMGLAVDTYMAYLSSVLARRDLAFRGVETLLAPPQYWGVSAGTATFGGTFSIRPETMQTLLVDILASLHRWGLDRVFIVNWHADYHHCKTILKAVEEARRSIGVDARSIIGPSDVRRFRLTGDEDYILVQQSPPSMGPPGDYVDMHAGSLETGIMAEYFPDDVNIDLARTLKDSELTNEDLRALGQGEEEIRRTIPHGYFGNPAGYDTAVARRFVEDYALDLANTISGFLQEN
jgi:creatinine amidohydrolase